MGDATSAAAYASAQGMMLLGFAGLSLACFTRRPTAPTRLSQEQTSAEKARVQVAFLLSILSRTGVLRSNLSLGNLGDIRGRRRAVDDGREVARYPRESHRACSR